jgi:hypothetical protein
VIAEPLSAGAVHDTVASPFPGAADGAAGASGTVAGTTAFDASDGALEPTALVAWTVKVYDVTLVSPVMVAAVAVPGTVAVAPPGVATTV